MSCACDCVTVGTKQFRVAGVFRSREAGSIEQPCEELWVHSGFCAQLAQRDVPPLITQYAAGRKQERGWSRQSDLISREALGMQPGNKISPLLAAVALETVEQTILSEVVFVCC
ncbi:hypothetical protein TL10_06765 [Mycolicibacterium llatzerense]|uniref:Uncharacterized protein n=1 Tax=Mycolicibacterium llatzerense TaxID=280871 RepID=A0A0D1J7S4_9MYCO|nr:hypothetical protein TL10_06765 [Mycolicibacterium llatzerense]